MNSSLPLAFRRLLLTGAAASSAALSVSCSAADASALAGALNGNGAKSASGRVSLAVSISGSGTQTTSGTTETKNELAQADLAFDLGEVPAIGGLIFKWDNAQYGGTASWFEEHITPSSVQIPGTRDYRNCTNVDSTTQNFSSAGVGAQLGDLKLELQGDQYELFIEAGGTGPTNVLEVFKTDCTGDGHVQRTTIPSISSGVPFSGYFSSEDGSASGARASIIRPLPKGATRVNDVLQWTAKWVVFSQGTTVVTVPVVARLTWDFTIKY